MELMNYFKDCELHKRFHISYIPYNNCYVFNNTNATIRYYPNKQMLFYNNNYYKIFKIQNVKQIVKYGYHNLYLNSKFDYVKTFYFNSLHFSPDKNSVISHFLINDKKHSFVFMVPLDFNFDDYNKDGINYLYNKNNYEIRCNFYNNFRRTYDSGLKVPDKYTYLNIFVNKNKFTGSVSINFCNSLKLHYSLTLYKDGEISLNLLHSSSEVINIVCITQDFLDFVKEVYYNNKEVLNELLRSKK